MQHKITKSPPKIVHENISEESNECILDLPKSKKNKKRNENIVILILN